MKQSILLLGGSAQQIPAILAAKQLGLRTVLIDYLPDNPGQHVADVWYPESTTDVAAVTQIAQKENVSGILAYASDPAALPAAIVASKLGLPTNPPKSVEILGIKNLFRDFLRDNGFACPKHFSFSTDDELDLVLEKVKSLTFPIVIKPTDSSGSKGVSFIQSPDGINNAIHYASEYSRNRILIAEEFIERGYPYVIGGDIFVVGGKVVLFGDMECLRDDSGKSLIPIGEKYPNGLTETQRTTLYNELQRLVDRLNICFGELNIELLIDQNDQPHFLELGARAGGNMIPIQLSDVFGIDLIKANVEAAMGLNVQLHYTEPENCFMTFVLHSHEDGVFDHVWFSEDIKPYIYRTSIYKKSGDEVEKFDGAGKAIGIVFFKFPSKSIMDKIELNIDELVKVMLKQ